MVKKKYVLGLAAFVAIIASVFFASAVLFTEQGSVTNPDNFYSPYETWINVSTNATVTGPGDAIIGVKANFTAINSTACGGNGYLALSYVNGNWVGNCSVSSFFTNVSQITPLQKNISFVVENATGNYSSMQQIGAPVVIMLHNLGVPNMSDPTGCTRFGSGTTNLSSTAITNFANVSYYSVHVQVNYTCISGGSFKGAVQDAFNDALLINLTSVNMSSSNIGTKLSNLKTTVQVNITNPRTFGASRISVDSTAFSELDTAGWVTLYGVPIVYWDFSSFTGENIGKLYGVSNGGFNGYSSTLGVSSWNISLQIAGFSGYNVTDNVAPAVSFVSPSASETRSVNNVFVNVSVNGTGTEISKLTINITNSSGQVNFTIYNASVNSANCKNTTLGGDFYYCAINATNLPNDGSYTVTVNAWDYGGASPGNTISATSSFSVDTTYPRVYLVSPIDSDDWDSSFTVTFKYNVSDFAIANCSLFIDDDIVKTDTSITVNTEQSMTYDVGSAGYYDWNVSCTDRAGHTNVSGEEIVHVTYEEDGSSSSSGGGGGTTSFWTSTFSPTSDQTSAGYNKMLKKGERIKMAIGKVNHYVGVVKLTSTKATINVSSDPQQAVMEVGDSEKFEVTNDSYYDIEVTLNSVNSTSANVTVQYIYEKMSVSATTEAAAEENESIRTMAGEIGEEIAESEAASAGVLKNKWFWISIVGVLLIAGVLFYYFLVMRKSGVNKRVKIRDK